MVLSWKIVVMPNKRGNYTQMASNNGGRFGGGEWRAMPLLLLMEASY